MQELCRGLPRRGNLAGWYLFWDAGVDGGKRVTLGTMESHGRSQLSWLDQAKDSPISMLNLAMKSCDSASIAIENSH